MRSVSRRRFLLGLGASGVATSSLLTGLSSLAGCLDGDTEIKRTPIPTRKHDVHVSLAHLTSWSREDVDDVALFVGGKRYELDPHTDETRAKLSANERLAVGAATHFVEDAEFSLVGAQSFVVGKARENGIVAPVLAGIHVPSAVPADAALPSGALEEGPLKVVSFIDAAIYCVYHNPQILSHDPDTAAAMIAHIMASETALNVIAKEIEEAGPGVTPEQAKAGISGWLAGEYLVDKNGRIPANQFGKAMPGDRFQWVADPDVQAATNACVAEVLLRIHGDTTLEGVKFLTSKGTATQETPTRLLAPLTHEEEHAFIFPDQGKMRGRRSLTVEKQTGTTFKVEVEQPNAVGSILGMRSFKADGTVLTEDKALGYIPGTYYPSIERILGPSKKVFENIQIPVGAARIDLFTAALAGHGGDLARVEGDKNLHNEGFNSWAGNILVSGILDFFLPLSMLALGLGGERVRDLTEKVVKEMVKELGVEILIDLGKQIAVDAFSIFAGTFGVEALLDQLKDIGVTIGTAIAHAIAKPQLAGVAALIAGAVGAAVAESGFEVAVPAIGWALKGIEVAQTAVQLGFQIAHIVEGLTLVRSELVPAHPVNVVVMPIDGIGYLPETAALVEVTVTPEGRLPIVTEMHLPSEQRSALTVKVEEPVALFGQLTVEVIMRNAAHEIVAQGRRTDKNGTEVGKDQEFELEVKPVPVPIRGSTKLVHLQKLEITPTGRKLVPTSTPPTADDTALSCTGGKVCRVLGATLSMKSSVLGYAFQTPMSCAANANASQIHLMNIKDASTKSLACGTAGPIAIALSITEGPSAVVAQMPDKRYGVFELDPAGALPASFEPAQARAILRGDALSRARMHEAGYLVALTSVGGEVVDLREATRLGRPADPLLFTRRGPLRGQMSGAVSIAPLRGLHGYALLEQGLKRIQALDFSGNYLEVWSGQSVITLRQDAGRIYTDLEVDGAGNIWVLSYVPNGSAKSEFVVDVYDSRGQFVVAFKDVNALGLTIDLYQGVFTENAENAIGPGGYPEPTISVWAPENPHS